MQAYIIIMIYNINQILNTVCPIIGYMVDLSIQLDKNRHFVEIFSFTRNCNWLDVVEVTFHTGEEPG